MLKEEKETILKRIENTIIKLEIDNSCLNGDPIIYHYTNYNAARSILRNSTLRFGNPAKFDDKKDMDLGLLSFETSTANYIKFFLQTHPNLSYSQLRKIERANTQNPYFYQEEAKIALEKLKANLGVTCFNQNHINHHLWKEYANNERGVCLGFRSSAIKYCMKSRVKYTDDELVENFFDESIEALVHWALIKKTGYTDENEIRAFCLNVKKHCLSMDEKSPYYRCISLKNSAIEEIYLGVDMPTYHKTNLIKILNQKNYPNSLKLYQMVKDFDTGEFLTPQKLGSLSQNL
ncbi:DUF2971 domain-containing protein [Pontibacter virosus]|uniref:DUF2971 family protein n=1 Tax=Pontibacter virosus TaxID=1765052 RepID=A0A2U1B381_9BACT|nr:DUF2971 domain-containing protein [Pontibacter virosus]PVY43146.1 hypothetical protein C8E01_102323 [Pontibacter virosus]